MSFTFMADLPGKKAGIAVFAFILMRRDYQRSNVTNKILSFNHEELPPVFRR